MTSYIQNIFWVLGLVSLVFLSSCVEQAGINALTQAEKDDQILQDYFRRNNLNPTKTKDGLYYIMIKEGSPTLKPFKGDSVVVHYTGNLLDGYRFDSSRFRDEPFGFRQGQGKVISGWEEAVLLLGLGARANFYLPSERAYGRTGVGGSIPGNAILVFDIEMIKFFK
ncbi:MAG: FKBP-type peptidyl-prolyl cis-trans isomerase [Cytophagales bacterium]|nr:MAG: FKBP-type peptidyl-prolyl cis-trans isomerase [Cytophagales bacterium]TAF59363.1 MAG: FKBP-type peptidyl-prolyl cis-trans isomerase [Cytophagales bacterium]